MENTISHDSKKWGMISHLSTFAGFLFPFGNLIAPLVIWLSKKDQDEFISDQAKEVLNFQITISLLFLLGFIIVIIQAFRVNENNFPLSIFVILILLGIVWMYDLIITLIGAIKANDGVRYRYPMNIRFIK